MQDNPTRILIVDDHFMVRKALVGILHTQPDFEVAAEAANGEEAVWLYACTQPDVVLMDLGMPRMDGVTAIAKLREHHLQARIIALTGSEDLVPSALHAGAVSYLLKHATSDAIFRAVRQAVMPETNVRA